MTIFSGLIFWRDGGQSLSDDAGKDDECERGV